MICTDRHAARWTRRNRGLWRLLFLVTLLQLGSAQAQEPDREEEEGLPYRVEQFTPKEYDAHRQNWAVVQDTNGLLYVGNNNGVLQYDGSSWRLIATPENFPARSLARGRDGRIYVGSVGDFGYLAPDSIGRRNYVSLTGHVPADVEDFGDVWSTSVTGRAVYFQAHEALYRWFDGNIRVWRPEEEFYKSFVVRSTLYVHDPSVGLMFMSDDSLELLPGGGTFQGAKVSVMLPLREGGLLIGTLEGKFYRYREGSVDRFITSAEELFAETPVYHGSLVSDSLIAIATIGGGVAIIDDRGRLRRILNAENGLLNDIVGYLYPDHQGGLWMAKDRGVGRMEIPPALTFFDKRGGLHGTVLDVVRHNDTLYAATQYNVYQKTTHCSSSIGNTCFEPVFDNQSVSWSLVSLEDDLLVARTAGIFQIDGRGIQQIAEGKPAFLYRSRRHPDRVYAGMKDGILMLERRGGAWVKGEYHPEVDRDVRSIVEDSSGVLWLGTYDRYVLRIDAAHASFTEAPVSQFSAVDGLPEGVVYVVAVADCPAFVTSEGVYRFTSSRGRTDTNSLRPYFHLDPAITAAFDDWSMNLLEVEEDGEGRVWFVFDEEVRVLHRGADGVYRRIPPPALRFGEDQVFSVYSEGRIAWLGSETGLIRYDLDRMTSAGRSMPAFVRRVTINGDSLLYAGTRDSAEPNVLGYGDKQIRFTYAAPVFDDREVIIYQSTLEGFDEDWSKWTNETHRTYTNLPEGEYTFRVRARDAYGYVSRTGTFDFSVLPPWYRTWWAYILYGVTLMGVVVGYGRMRASAKSKKLERQRLITDQLKEANARLEEANRLKDEFLTTISHEFRTPLASMAGFASILEEEVDEDKRHFARYIQESGSRLQETLKAVLDLAKLRAGRVDVNPEPADVVSSTLGVVEFFRPLAEEKGLALVTDLPDCQVTARLDTFSFERVLNNLISNAVKFTDEGSVVVRVRAAQEEVHVQVEDTGVGISDEFQSKLFDEFRQESSGLSRSHQGVGLGLAITRHLIDLMKADIRVESTKGEGSVFTVTLQRSLDESEVQSRKTSARSNNEQ